MSLPGTVQRYDAATQLADVKPQIKGTFEDEDGTVSQHSLPVITNVPVVFPGGGGFRVTFPVRAGDTVLLVFADRSLDAWLSEGHETGPDDMRRHALSDAVCIPGLHPNNAPWAGASETNLTLGKDNGPQVIVDGSNIHIGSDIGSEPTLKATTYRAAENTYFTGLQTAIAAALSSLGLTAAATALTAVRTAFDLAAAAAPSTIAKVK